MFMFMNRILCQKPEFCVKSRLFEKVDFFRTGNFCKNTEFFVKHGILCQKLTFLKKSTFSNGEFCVKTRVPYRVNNVGNSYCCAFCRIKNFIQHVCRLLNKLALLKKVTQLWPICKNQRLKR